MNHTTRWCWNTDFHFWLCPVWRVFLVLSNKGLLSSYYYSINMQGAKNCQFGHTHVNVVQSVSIEFPYCVLRTRLAKHRSRVDELGHPSSESQVRYTWPATNIVLCSGFLAIIMYNFEIKLENYFSHFTSVWNLTKQWYLH